jgi:NAD(P)-dependent dehydrogenase (short-subunit alcohol dehydrogenase family)
MPQLGELALEEPAMTDEFASSELISFRLDGRLAIITGASEGIGRTFAHAFCLAGAEVVLVGRRHEVLQNVHREISAMGGKAHVVCADLTRLDDIRSLEESVLKLIENTQKKLVLVNNAGFAFTKAALDVTEDDWDRVLDLHVKGTFFCSQRIGRLMIDCRYGKIINLSSTWSVSTDVGKSVYGVAKAAISYLTAGLSTEWASSGVRVNAIAPCTTLSENTLQHVQQNPARSERMLQRIQLGRFAAPADLAGAAVFLASPASDFITGHTLFVDGGWHAGR